MLSRRVLRESLVAAGIFVLFLSLGLWLGSLSAGIPRGSAHLLGASPGRNVLVGAGSTSPPGVGTTLYWILSRNLLVMTLLGLGLATGGLLAAVVLAYNGFALGTLMPFLLSLGLTRYQVVMSLAPHGILELPALFIAGGVGLRGAEIIRRLLKGQEVEVGRELAVGLTDLRLALLLLLTAGLVEAIVSRLIWINMSGG